MDLATYISAVDRAGKLDTALGDLPNANPSALHDHWYYRLQKANRILAEAELMRQEAVAQIATELQRDWTEREVIAAFRPHLPK